MAENQINNMSPTHVNICNWLVANPGRPNSECAEHFGITQSWLSTIIHSDIFQAYLRNRQDEHFENMSLTIHEKMEATAHIALEKTSEVLEQSNDPGIVVDATDKLLSRLGYGNKTAIAVNVDKRQNNQVNNFGSATPEDLARAREAMNVVKPALEHKPAETLPLEVKEAVAGD